MILNQGTINNCVASSIAYGYYAKFGKLFDVNFIHGRRVDYGTSIEKALEILKTEGNVPLCTEYSMDGGMAHKWVSDNLYELQRTARDYRIEGYKRISTAEELRQALQDGHYVIFSTLVTTREVGADYVFRPRAKADDYVGVHAMTAWKYCSDAVLVRNSWGAEWGDNGSAFMLAENILRGEDCWCYWFEKSLEKVDGTTEKSLEKVSKGALYMHLKRFVDCTDGKSLILRDEVGGEKVGTMADNAAVTVLATEGEYSLITDGSCGWVKTSYLVENNPVKAIKQSGEYNDTIKVTEKDYTRPIGKRHVVKDFILRDDLGAQLICPTIVELIEAAEEHFGGKVKFPTGNSLYRTVASNRACGGAGSSRHITGIAADFRIMTDKGYVNRNELAMWAEKYMNDHGYKGGIGVYASASEHIHVDLRGSWSRWWKVTSGSNTPSFGGVAAVFCQGHRSPAIAKIQSYLNEHGYACGNADGAFGAKTTAALKKWQADNKLATDGKFGKDTNRVMGVFVW